MYLIHYLINLHRNFILDERTVRPEAHRERSSNLYKPNIGHIGDINFMINYSLECTHIPQALLAIHEQVQFNPSRISYFIHHDNCMHSKSYQIYLNDMILAGEYKQQV